MQIEVNDDKLVEILNQRGELFKGIGDINEKLGALDKERTKLGYKMDKLKEKTKIIIDKLEPKLEEFEFIARIFLEDGKAFYEVLDMVEEYKKSVRESQKKKAEVK